jgi:hypothetical protein
MTAANAASEDWKLLLSFFPPNWKELGRVTEALKGLRQDKSEENYMRTLLLHLGCGFSMRETVVRARQPPKVVWNRLMQAGSEGPALEALVVVFEIVGGRGPARTRAVDHVLEQAIGIFRIRSEFPHDL